MEDKHEQEVYVTRGDSQRYYQVPKSFLQRSLETKDLGNFDER